MVGAAIAATLTASLFIGWNQLVTPPLAGRYVSAGEVQLANGEVVSVSTTSMFSGDRFFMISRQGAAVLELSGKFSRGLLGSYRLLIEKGEVTGLDAETHDDLLFNMLYTRTPGSVISLEPFRGCLYALETRQLYCPEQDSGD